MEGKWHPKGSADDPRTWIVHPTANTLRDLYAALAIEYGFDQRVSQLVCTLNTTNMNIFLNTFRMHGDPGVAWQRGEGPSKKAMAYISVKILGKDREGPKVRNQGVRWWKDTAASHQPGLVLAQRNEMHGSSRGRSPTTRNVAEGPRSQRMSKGDLEDVLYSLRRDCGACRDMTEMDVEDMLQVAILKYKEGTTDDPTTFNGPGTLPGFMDYRRRCSSVNLAKLELLEKINAGLVNILANTMEGRVATSSMNSYIGNDITNLLEYAHDYLLTQDEEGRFEAKWHEDPKDISCRVCTHFIRKGRCSRGQWCSMLHLVHESTYGTVTSTGNADFGLPSVWQPDEEAEEDDGWGRYRRGWGGGGGGGSGSGSSWWG